MKSYVILSEKKWNQNLVEEIATQVPANWYLINQKDDFNLRKLESLQADKIFIPHWSYLIPAEIYENYECIVFHMTDLPFGRGGSPLQNLIVRGYKETKISALRVVKEIDAGDVYLKKSLSLLGTAEEIFLRASQIVQEMILEIVKHEPPPIPQQGEVTIFKRRKPEDGNLANLENIEQLFDFIRMLDAEGYPSAFLEINNFRLEFSRASLKSNKMIFADVKIIEK